MIAIGTLPLYLNEVSICSQAMSEDERVDLVSFTGSTPVKSQSTFLFIN